jgi:hypothetical protein
LQQIEEKLSTLFFYFCGFVLPLVEREDKCVIQCRRIAICRLTDLHPVHDELQKLVNQNPIALFMTAIDFVQPSIVHLQHVSGSRIQSL